MERRPPHLTVNGAEMLGLDDRLGDVKPGKLADLIAIEGNPLKKIEALREVRGVVMEGEEVQVTNDT